MWVGSVVETDRWSANPACGRECSFHALLEDYLWPLSDGRGGYNCAEIRQLIKHLKINEGVLMLPLPACRRNVFNYV